MLSAQELIFGRRETSNAATRWAPSTWDDPMWRGATALAVGSLLAPVLVTGILVLGLLAVPLSGSLPAARPSIESRITRVFDSAGGEIANFRRFETSFPVAREDIPPVLVDAVVAMEDQRFYEHRGVDSRGIVRALAADLQGGGYVEGASTITQQYVRLVYAGDERTLGRKVREAVLAGRVEKVLSKDEIMYRYLSRAYFGSGAYGVGAAAITYFRKPVRDLSLSEAALLAGLLSAPSRLDPRTNPGEAESQRSRALDKMLEQGRITPAQHGEAAAQRVAKADNGLPKGEVATVVYPAQEAQSRFPWFGDYVRRYLLARYGDEKVYQGGLRVETSVDPGLQAKAEAAVTQSLKGTQAPLDMALTSIDPRTGLVKAMVGGRDFAKSQVNLALGSCRAQKEPVKDKPVKDDVPLCVAGGGTGRQPGSSFKPFTLAKAFEEGMSVDKTYPGPGKYTYPRCRGEGCTVANVESGSYGSLDLRQATAYSVNTVYAQLVQDVGVKDTAELANRLGVTMIDPGGKLESGEPYGPSLTLGAAEVSPLDMAAAFGVFAARGKQFPASPVLRVLGPDGQVLEDNRSRAGKRVLSESVADKVTDVLKDVVGYGTGKGADIGRPNGTAGKTGTSENYSDAWFVGYTPQLSTAVWMGYADSQKPLVNVAGLPRVFGGTLPAATWKNFMSAALEGTPPLDFPTPPRPLPPPPAPYTPPAPRVTETVPAPTVPAYGQAPYPDPLAVPPPGSFTYPPSFEQPPYVPPVTSPPYIPPYNPPPRFPF